MLLPLDEIAEISARDLHNAIYIQVILFGARNGSVLGLMGGGHEELRPLFDRRIALEP